MNSTQIVMAAVALTFALGGCAADKEMAAKQGDAKQAAAVEKCFGVAKAGANDCKSGSHACAGHSKVDADPASFVVVPAGTCDRITGGKVG